MKISRKFVVVMISVACLLVSIEQARAQQSGGEPPVAATHCCDAAEEPGSAGNQHCAAGYVCCADGSWKCNDAAGSANCSGCGALCCDPFDEPGQYGNPVCVEGATCCADGLWRCNDGSGGSTCTVDGVPCNAACCNPREEPGQSGNPPCVEGATCCATGEFQCNDPGANSTCEVDSIVCEDCCSVLEEPGQFGNPPCIEGATCCSDGAWQCNGATGQSTCALDGVVCDPGCCDPLQRPNLPGNEYCASGFLCCEDGTWQCNDSTGVATCAPGVECPEICGGIAGIPCDAANEFCKLPTGECCCDAFGICTEIPEACPEFLDPVCGCDGVTYDNECFADAAGVSVEHPGPCLQVCGGIAGIPCEEGEFCLLPEGQCCCDFEGVCVPIPQQCPGDCDPVCGCDGRTFKNACVAVMNEVSIDHVGPCFEGGGLITGVGFESRVELGWEPQNAALFYNVYRNVVESDPPLSAGVCFKTEVVETGVPVNGAPHPGVLWLFQVAGQYADGEGPLGINWTCEPRTPALSCSPSEQVLCEATGGIWDPLSCGHYPCGQFPPCDAIIPGCNCGPGNNYTPEVGCLPDPTCP